MGPLFPLAGGSSHGGAGRATGPEPPAGSSVVSFASRAGYSPTYLAEVRGAHAAAGGVPVEVTFASPRSIAEYGAVLAFFRAEGLTIASTDPGRLFLGVEGSASAVGRAFSTQLVSGTYGGSPVLFPAIPPALPSAIETEVAGIVGLSSGFTRFSFDLQPVSPPAAVGERAVPAGPDEMTPAYAREFYQFS